jgi:hypothetical protein
MSTAINPPTPPPLQVNAAVASHFIPEEMRAASAWQARHPEIPAMGDFLKVSPIRSSTKFMSNSSASVTAVVGVCRTMRM